MDNAPNAAKIALGRALFVDPRLSLDGRHSCASCHDPARAYTDGRARAIGATGATLAFNAPALANVAWLTRYGWRSPRVTTLEQQMRLPLFGTHPIELGLAGREESVVAMLAADDPLRRDFGAAFPEDAEPLTLANVIRAIATFERTLVSGDSPFDRYVFGGRHDAIDATAKRGMRLFYSRRLGCGRCHAGFNFSGPVRGAAGVDTTDVFADNGLDGRASRVPSLRNLPRTAPYMHDGRFAQLDAVLDHYERAGRHRHRDPRLGRFTLSRGERRALLAFLQSLDDGSFGAAQGRPEQ